MKAIKWGLGISACLILLVILDQNRNDNQPVPASPQPTAEQQQDERQRKAQEELALTLTQAYRNEGYEVTAVPRAGGSRNLCGMTARANGSVLRSGYWSSPLPEEDLYPSKSPCSPCSK